MLHTELPPFIGAAALSLAAPAAAIAGPDQAAEGYLPVSAEVRPACLVRAAQDAPGGQGAVAICSSGAALTIRRDREWRAAPDSASGDPPDPADAVIRVTLSY